MSLVVGSNPQPPTAPTQSKTPVLDRSEAYVTDDGYEQVVRFYQGALKLSPSVAHPKDLPSSFPGQPIPAHSRGRRSVFRLGTGTSSPAGPSIEQRIIGQALGGTNVVVSDFSVDPQTHQLTGQTSIVVLVYR
jgi:hypothetical protein